MKIVIAAGLAGAAAIDLYLTVIHAVVLHDASALAVQQWDASNALGPAAFAQPASAWLGFCMHALVSIGWAAIYVLASARLPVLRANYLVSGTILGIAAFLVMRYAVVPLGHAQLGGIHTFGALINLLVAHTIFFGIPLVATVDWMRRTAANAVTAR